MPHWPSLVKNIGFHRWQWGMQLLDSAGAGWYGTAQAALPSKRSSWYRLKWEMFWALFAQMQVEGMNFYWQRPKHMEAFLLHLAARPR